MNNLLSLKIKWFSRQSRTLLKVCWYIVNSSIKNTVANKKIKAEDIWIVILTAY